jgi:hypothetical protein
MALDKAAQPEAFERVEVVLPEEDRIDDTDFLKSFESPESFECTDVAMDDQMDFELVSDDVADLSSLTAENLRLLDKEAVGV